MTGTIRVLLVEDHRLVREGIGALLAGDPRIDVVGEAEDGLTALRVAAALTPDLVLMDLSLPRMGGADATREVRKRLPGTRVVMLTASDSEDDVMEALRAGADGYLHKTVTREELVLAIETVIAGGRCFPPSVPADAIAQAVAGGNPDLRVPLTIRERQVLKLVAEGHRNREIAAQLFISIKTVENHRANLMRKLRLHNTAELTAYAIRHRMTQG